MEHRVIQSSVQHDTGGVHQGLYRLFDLIEVALCKRSNDELHALIDPPFYG